MEGESGTGKELVARLAHCFSPHRTGPFVPVNCGCLDRTLARSDLFGHERGAFTGAVESRPGAFDRSQGGTLFLDEIGDLPLDVQPELLRAIEQKTFERVGGSAPVAWDGGLVCATHRDLDEFVRAGKFRLDLHHRLAGLRVRLPPLRERRGEVRLLADEFIARLGSPEARFGPGVMEALESYDWPGNVRELECEVKAASALAEGPEIALHDLKPAVREAARSIRGTGKGMRARLEAEKRRLAEEALRGAEGCKRAAARSLGMDHSSFLRLCRRLELRR